MNLEAMRSGAVQYRSTATVEDLDRVKSELLIKCAPYDVEADVGPFFETFARGTFARAAKSPHRLGLWHEHNGPLTGRGIEAEDRTDGFYMRAKLAKTQAAQDMATLIEEELLRDASAEFTVNPDFLDVTHDPSGKLHIRHRRAAMRGCAIVFEGVYGDAAQVVAMRDEDRREHDVEAARMWLLEYRRRVVFGGYTGR